MEKLNELVSICKGEVIITVNEHRSNYETPEEYLHWRKIEVDDIDAINAGNLYVVQAYPKTPVGFVVVAGADLDKLFDEIIKAAKEY